MERALARHGRIAGDSWRCCAASIPPFAAARARQSDALSARSARRSRSHEPRRGSHPAWLPRGRARHIRTNFTSATPAGTKDYISVKLDPAKIRPALPREIRDLRLRPRVEGVHLRMAAVARGGIRWSDRREDFRTEVLGLMKAPTSEHRIVPAGARRLRGNCRRSARDDLQKGDRGLSHVHP